MRYVIVIFTIACILLWDGWYNAGRWLDAALRLMDGLLASIGLG